MAPSQTGHVTTSNKGPVVTYTQEFALVAF